MKGVLTIASSALPVGTELLGFRGREAISTPYAFDVGITIPHDADVDLVDILGAKVTLGVDITDKPAFPFHGVIASAELVQEQTDRSVVLLRMVPRLWQLTLTHHSRIFTQCTIPEIIEATLKYSGIPPEAFRITLAGTYEKLEHVCQYREDNLAFISRLMEREGMYYYFEHGDDGEVMVIVDHRSFHQPARKQGVRFYPSAESDVTAGEALALFKCRVQALPARVELKDYNYVRPTLDVRGEARIAERGQGDIVMYGENFLTPVNGARYAELRAEEYLTRQRVFHGSGRVLQLRAGTLFDLEEHPRPAFNSRYLLTALEHTASQAADGTAVADLLELRDGKLYHVEVDAIPAPTQFRAARATPWPRVDGVVDGVVDGAAGGPYAEIDEHGRYKVRLFFDESDLVDGSASTWIRMLQPHGGGTEGFHFPLRKGTEVHVLFLGGDPDRPVIAGVAHNSHKPSKVTASNHTQNVIMTGGSNRLELEDKAGGQYVTMSSPTANSYTHMGAGDYNYVAHTDGHHLGYTGGNQDLQVIGDKSEDVTGSVTDTYLSSWTSTVTGGVRHTYQSTYDLNVWSPVSFTFDTTFSHSVTGAVTESFESTQELTVEGAVTETFNTSLTQNVNGPVTENHKGNKSTTITGEHTLTATGAQTIHSDASQTVTAPTQNFTSEALQELHSTDLVVSASATISATAGSEATITAPTTTVEGTGTITITGGQINITGGDITMSGGKLTVTHGEVSINGSPIAVDGGGEIGMTAGVIKLN